MFELLFERSADPIWLFDPRAGVFLDCNQAAVELLQAGCKARLLQTRPEDLSPLRQPDGSLSRDKAAEVTEIAARAGGHRFEWVARRFDGKEIPLEVVATPIPANGGHVHVVVSRDITERRQAEEALRENQQVLASIADNISEAIYRSDPDHRLMFVNRAYLKLFGYGSLAELQALPREQLYADPTTRSQLLELLLRDGAFSHQEVEYVRKDGSRFWGLSSGRIIRDPHTGRGIFQVGAITDITARKKDEAEIRRLNQSLERRISERTAELAASEARFRALVEHAPEAIVVFDGTTGRFLFGNNHACRLYGVTAEELTRLTPADVSPEVQPNGRPSTEFALENMRAALAGQTPVFEWVHRQPSGRLIPTEVRLLRLPAEGKNLLRASIIDNTERKRAEAELHKMLAREQELGQLKSNFVSMVSHEFRTPLGIIQSSGEILRDYFERLDSTARQDQLQSIIKNTRRMAEMMEEVLVLSRLDSGRMEFKPTPLDLRESCRRVVGEVLSATDRRCPIELSFRAFPIPARADESLLSHIFTNLLTNAVKYSEPGRTVRFTIRRERGDAVCVIRDQGIGIPDADQQWLFTAFQRGSNVGDRPGTGLGLVLVKRCVDSHGGNIELKSKVGEGTTVTVRLPVFGTTL